MKLLAVQFSPASHLCFLGPNIVLSIFFSTLPVFSLIWETRFHTRKKEDLKLYCILIVTFFHSS
jgi:hypothetical protein